MCHSEVDRRRRHRKILKVSSARVLEPMKLAVFETNNIAFNKRFDSSSFKMEIAVPAEGDPDLF